jgi:DNA sulfur modification protein DndC
MAYIDKMLARLQAAAESLHLPIVTVKTAPAPDQTFWVNLIGRGYPAPTRMFRWCTDRMKIAPTSNYIRNKVTESGKVILLLGVRRAESANRAVTMNRHPNVAGSRLNPHDDLTGCMVFRPLIEMTTDDVWSLLLQRKPPWGGSHRELVALYSDAQGGECPLVMDKSQAPSCGTSSSRFGCWTCTVVEKDRSLEGFIDAGFENMAPLCVLYNRMATWYLVDVQLSRAPRSPARWCADARNGYRHISGVGRELSARRALRRRYEAKDASGESRKRCPDPPPRERDRFAPVEHH